MPYLILGIAVLAGLLLLARWLTTASPQMLAWLVRVLGGLVLLAFAAFVAFSGRYVWIAYALPFLIPIFFQWRSHRIRQGNAQGPSPGQSSGVTTAWLRMGLDHDTGDMWGTVVKGRFAGRGLETMGLEELLALYDECRGDSDSARVLEAYLDRRHGARWREGAAAAGAAGAGAGMGTGSRWGRAAAPGPMTRAEAYEILGLEPGASDEEIRDAHRKLMAKLHPDRGGSTYLAAKINEAKDLLLKG